MTRQQRLRREGHGSLWIGAERLARNGVARSALAGHGRYVRGRAGRGTDWIYRRGEAAEPRMGMVAWRVDRQPWRGEPTPGDASKGTAAPAWQGGEWSGNERLAFSPGTVGFGGVRTGEALLGSSGMARTGNASRGTAGEAAVASRGRERIGRTGLAGAALDRSSRLGEDGRGNAWQPRWSCAWQGAQRRIAADMETLGRDWSRWARQQCIGKEP